MKIKSEYLTMNLETSLSTQSDSVKGGREKMPYLPTCQGSSQARRKTMLTEQSNFLFLKRTVSKHLPTKKFKACAPCDFSKLILCQNNTIINPNYKARYNYPSEVLSNYQIYRMRFFSLNHFTHLKKNCYKDRVTRLKTIIY